jgi:hypothetical protein
MFSFIPQLFYTTSRFGGRGGKIRYDEEEQDYCNISLITVHSFFIEEQLNKF